MISSTGIMLYRLVKANGWQLAIALMEYHKHPSRIWEWPQSLQMFEYASAKTEMEKES